MEPAGAVLAHRRAAVSVAMTLVARSRLPLGVIARLDRAIPYSETSVVDREVAAYWIPRFRGE
ncbi:hypothetical protein C7U65_14535 [Bradyrhizobium sp. WBAH23]|nr:hypothetical protein [Bradyrhizobium sp. WBAH30]MDD1556834.1 hypothetical protein [Bradyrhizobium sp. WBAH23]MDD1589812.1 hypothetical protein [Bradyrhizobium sp. WBAH42]NRB88757.1 hypothetical protein [Bradyrhizobium sp. WBAH10]QCJ90903.1 hypothetical protein DAA57_22110 [Bradyrhizobium yuanmingense]